MADEKNVTDQALAYAKAKETEASNQTVAQGEGKGVTKPEQVADEEHSKNVVGRSEGAKAIATTEQNPAFSSNQDKAKKSEQAFLAELPDTTLLVYTCGPEVRLGQFWTLGVNGHEYVFEEGQPTPVENADVKDILKIAGDTDYYTITKA